MKDIDNSLLLFVLVIVLWYGACQVGDIADKMPLPTPACSGSAVP